MKLLDPKLDIVFKLLMQRELVLLRSMIETVVSLPAPIEDLVILNPELPKDLARDKGIVLDVRVSLANKAKFDIEMQSELPVGIRSRFLYYWAKEYSGELQRGDEYPQLIPVISIIWLGSNLLKGEKFHRIFHLSEDTTRELFTFGHRVSHPGAQEIASLVRSQPASALPLVSIPARGFRGRVRTTC